MRSPRRNVPYFKCQTFDDRSMTWREYRWSFDTIEEARQHLQETASGRKWKIVMVDEEGHHDVEASECA